jgi:hypothetical protein
LLAAQVYERCGRAIIHIVEAPANQGKSFGTEILDRRGKIESAIKSGLNRMLVQREHGPPIFLENGSYVARNRGGL